MYSNEEKNQSLNPKKIPQVLIIVLSIYIQRWMPCLVSVAIGKLVWVHASIES
jgi:hypothetical protein